MDTPESSEVLWVPTYELPSVTCTLLSNRRAFAVGCLVSSHLLSQDHIHPSSLTGSHTSIFSHRITHIHPSSHFYVNFLMVILHQLPFGAIEDGNDDGVRDHSPILGNGPMAWRPSTTRSHPLSPSRYVFSLAPTNSTTAGLQAAGKLFVPVDSAANQVFRYDVNSAASLLLTFRNLVDFFLPASLSVPFWANVHFTKANEDVSFDQFALQLRGCVAVWQSIVLEQFRRIQCQCNV